jgi:hypothetical protein
MAERDTLLAVVGGDVGIAGLILVFAGFVITKAESFAVVRKANAYRWIARLSLIPILASLGSAWLSIDAIEGCAWCGEYSLYSLKIVLALTGTYAVVGALFTF